MEVCSVDNADCGDGAEIQDDFNFYLIFLVLRTIVTLSQSDYF